MSTGTEKVTDVGPKPRVLRIFISYAKEDQKIAIAVYNAIQTALGAFADVFIDDALRFGLKFQDEIKKRLDQTDVLVVIYSAELKPSHSFTGMELGYFMRVIERETSFSDFKRRIIPIYVDGPPDTLSDMEGINIGISRSTLAMTFEEYEATLTLDADNRMVKFLQEFQEVVDKIREKNGFPKVPQSPDQQDVLELVRKMQLAIFSHLRTSPESTLKPQKQIIISTNDVALESSGDDLPSDAVLTPVGSGNPMSVFGLPSTETTWGDFQRLIKNAKFRDSWIDAITSVVTSSLQSQLEVDNSQVIVSQDEKHAFRVILTSGTKYFNGVREFNLYFVEYLRRGDFGDQSTTLLLKGLELSCRFRFLFLERNSEFSSMSIRIANPAAIRDVARKVEREMNLLLRDALGVGLDKANVWADFVDWPCLARMNEAWQPIELKIRDNLTEIRRCCQDSETLPALRESLAASIQELETTFKPLNAELIDELTDKLKDYIHK